MEEGGRRAQSWDVVEAWGMVPDIGYVSTTIATKSAKVLFTQRGAARQMPALLGRLLPNGNTYGYASLYTSVNYLWKFLCNMAQCSLTSFTIGYMSRYHSFVWDMYYIIGIVL